MPFNFVTCHQWLPTPLILPTTDIVHVRNLLHVCMVVDTRPVVYHPCLGSQSQLDISACASFKEMHQLTGRIYFYEIKNASVILNKFNYNCLVSLHIPLFNIIRSWLRRSLILAIHMTVFISKFLWFKQAIASHRYLCTPHVASRLHVWEPVI